MQPLGREKVLGKHERDGGSMKISTYELRSSRRRHGGKRGPVSSMEVACCPQIGMIEYATKVEGDHVWFCRLPWD